MIFTADSDGFWGGGRNKDVVKRSRGGATLEPITLYSALTAITTRIGFVATASTTYNEPYHLACKFASLDHISDGRAGWNAVTSGNESAAFNFGLDTHPSHETRYRRAAEFLDVVKGLWDSWEDDAFSYYKESGIFFDPERLHVLNHTGEFFKERGPLNVPRSPQGYPVIVQAGSSEPGKELAARTAEIVFTGQRTLDEAQAFYRDVKSRLARYGRQLDTLKIMPWIFLVIGRTDEGAKEKYEELQDLIHPSVGLAMLSGMAGGVDRSEYPLDRRNPPVSPPPPVRFRPRRSQRTRPDS
jgi:alkanesulfonate monooxygenase